MYLTKSFVIIEIISAKKGKSHGKYPVCRKGEHPESAGGEERVTSLLLTALVAGGHVLIEDVPGMGKTVLARSLAKSVDGAFGRIQFTPGPAAL